MSHMAMVERPTLFFQYGRPTLMPLVVHRNPMVFEHRQMLTPDSEWVHSATVGRGSEDRVKGWEGDAFGSFGGVLD